MSDGSSTTFDVYCTRHSDIMLFVSLETRVREIIKGESLASFAKRIGVSRSTLYAAFEREAEKGAHNIDQDTARRLATAAGRSVEWILTGEEGSAPRRPESTNSAEPVELEPRRADNLRDRVIDALIEDEITDDHGEAYRVVRAV